MPASAFQVNVAWYGDSIVQLMGQYQQAEYEAWNNAVEWREYITLGLTGENTALSEGISGDSLVSACQNFIARANLSFMCAVVAVKLGFLVAEAHKVAQLARWAMTPTRHGTYP